MTTIERNLFGVETPHACDEPKGISYGEDIEKKMKNFSKPLDTKHSMCYTIIVKGIEKGEIKNGQFVIGNPLDRKNIKKHKKGIDRLEKI